MSLLLTKADAYLKLRKADQELAKIMHGPDTPDDRIPKKVDRPKTQEEVLKNFNEQLKKQSEVFASYSSGGRMKGDSGH